MYKCTKCKWSKKSSKTSVKILRFGRMDLKDMIEQEMHFKLMILVG